MNPTTPQKENPDSAIDQVWLACSVLSELHALVESISALNKMGMSSNVESLIDLACRHAEEWTVHFEHQKELFGPLDQVKKGGQS